VENPCERAGVLESQCSKNNATRKVLILCPDLAESRQCLSSFDSLTSSTFCTDVLTRTSPPSWRPYKVSTKKSVSPERCKSSNDHEARCLKVRGHTADCIFYYSDATKLNLDKSGQMSWLLGTSSWSMTL
jgi:hypothetical protein